MASRSASPRVVIIGLDCAPPSLLFDRCRSVMPHVSRLIDRGVHGPLRSSEPPITVPAWACMTSGRDAGELGLYGFRNRVRNSYALRVATASDVQEKRLWDYLSDAGRRVAALFVPLTSPPRPVRGVMVSDFLTPPGAPHTFPPGLAAELEAEHGAYRPDVADFRTDDLDRVWSELHETGRQHFAIARHVLRTREPEFLMMVEMGPDRFHHAFWAHFDPDHPRHAALAGQGWADAPERYYAFLDAQIGGLLADLHELDPDATVMIVSDHGARAMQGGFCINEWLRDEGLLACGDAAEPTPLRSAGVDWSRTKAWAEGGYYARLFLNVEGREPEGVVPAAEFESTRDRIIEALGRVTFPDGTPFPIRAVKPEEAYASVRGEPPDLLLYLDDLRYRALGTVGHGALFRATNDGGPDGCNHDWDGVFVASGPGIARGERVEGASLFDLTPTVLARYGLSVPGLQGRDLLGDPGA